MRFTTADVTIFHQRVSQQTFVDTYAKVAFAKLYTTKTPIAAADLLNDRVLPFYQEQQVPLLRVLTVAAALMELGGDSLAAGGAARNVAGAERAVEMAKAGAIQQEIRAGIAESRVAVEKAIEALNQLIK